MAWSSRWFALVVVVVIGVTVPATLALADTATGGQGGDSGVPASLTVTDYEPFVLTVDDLESIPGFDAWAPLVAEPPVGFFAGIGDSAVPAICGEGGGDFIAGATVDTFDAATGGDGTYVRNSLGAVSNAKQILADRKASVQSCDGPFLDGRHAPAPDQPKLKKAGDGKVVVLMSTQTAPPGDTFYTLFVRRGKYLLSGVTMSVASDATLTTKDLDRLAKRMAAQLGDAERASKET
ncbi:MAG: hypothetical protein ACRDY6_17015 [Acidimicrobiia bacterium]